MRRTATQRRNRELSHELTSLNRSLETQVLLRTAELQALSTRLLHVQEEERRAIARELHDQVGQLLTGLKFQLESAAKTAIGSTAETLNQSLGLTTDLILRVRELTQQLRPRILDDLGLKPALEWYVDQFERQNSIKIALEVSLPADRLAADLETVVFRIVQEALTNVAKHAGVQSAFVTVTSGRGSLIAEIADRGAGFDVVDKLWSRDSNGLIGLRERATLVGGRIEIYSRTGEGTRIHAEFPLPPNTI